MVTATPPSQPLSNLHLPEPAVTVTPVTPLESALTKTAECHPQTIPILEPPNCVLVNSIAYSHPLSPFFSHSCALFCATGAMQVFWNQFVAHSFSCNGGCVPPWHSPFAQQRNRTLLGPAGPQGLVASLSSTVHGQPITFPLVAVPHLQCYDLVFHDLS